MGDRGNIIIHGYDHDAPVYIYAHWHGSDLPTLLADALATPQAQARVGDGKPEIGWMNAAELTGVALP